MKWYKHTVIDVYLDFVFSSSRDFVRDWEFTATFSCRTLTYVCVILRMCIYNFLYSGRENEKCTRKVSKTIRWRVSALESQRNSLLVTPLWWAVVLVDVKQKCSWFHLITVERYVTPTLIPKISAWDWLPTWIKLALTDLVTFCSLREHQNPTYKTKRGIGAF